MNCAIARTHRLLATIVIVIFCGVLAHAQNTIHVLVLNGKSGKPISGRNVKIFDSEAYSKSPFWPIVEGHTDHRGVFTTSAQLPKRITVLVNGRFHCERGGYGGSYPKDNILSVGVVESNPCNSKVIRAPMPGELILFVRRESLKEFLDID